MAFVDLQVQEGDGLLGLHHGEVDVGHLLVEVGKESLELILVARP